MRILALGLLLAATVASATPPAALATGMSAYGAGDFTAARRAFESLADDGSAIGETMLGTLYAHGQGVRRDPAAAAAYYCRAANRGYAPAQLAFAKALARGDGVAADRVAAWRWLRLAEQRGDARTVAAATAEAARLTAAAPPPADDTADWRPWPGGDD
jgi:TPR repeat protein